MAGWEAMGGGGAACGVRGVPPMHPMSFLQKRSHLCAVARGREMFEGVADMTPARFDILYLLHEQVSDVVSGARSNTIAQAWLRRLLGLSRQTVWKMVERLVELGLMTKKKDVHGPDRRRNILSLTAEGIRRIRHAFGAAFSERMPLPRDAPAGEDVPRYWRRPELADVRRGRAGEVIPPQKVGREVAKIYTSFAWSRAGKTRRQKRRWYLDVLDRMIVSTRDLADALGDSAAMIYPVWERDH